jgi:hypothetical protein
LPSYTISCFKGAVGAADALCMVDQHTSTAAGHNSPSCSSCFFTLPRQCSLFTAHVLPSSVAKTARLIATSNGMVRTCLGMELCISRMLGSGSLIRQLTRPEYCLCVRQSVRQTDGRTYRSGHCWALQTCGDHLARGPESSALVPVGHIVRSVCSMRTLGWFIFDESFR